MRAHDAAATEAASAAAAHLLVQRHLTQGWLRRHGRPVQPDLTPAVRRQFQEAFALLDSDGSGSLDATEVYRGFKALRLPTSRAAVKAMVAAMSDEQSGGVTYASFERLVAGAKAEMPQQGAWRAGACAAAPTQRGRLREIGQRLRGSGCVQTLCHTQKRVDRRTSARAPAGATDAAAPPPVPLAVMARSLRRVKLLNAVLLDREAALAEYRQHVAGEGTPLRLKSPLCCAERSVLPGAQARVRHRRPPQGRRIMRRRRRALARRRRKLQRRRGSSRGSRRRLASRRGCTTATVTRPRRCRSRSRSASSAGAA
jgi:hypothetical protein